MTAPAPPQHPFLAPDPGNNIHNDAYMTDVYPGPGPLGISPKVTSTLQVAECGSLTFDRRGRVETVCVGATRPTLKLFDPTTLKRIASYGCRPGSSASTCSATSPAAATSTSTTSTARSSPPATATSS